MRGLDCAIGLVEYSEVKKKFLVVNELINLNTTHKQGGILRNDRTLCLKLVTFFMYCGFYLLVNMGCHFIP